MGQRRALIVGNTHFDDARFASIARVDAPIADLEDVLRAPSHGAFEEVIVLENEPQMAVRRGIARFFRAGQHDELLLLCIIGPVVADERGHHYLAVRDSEPDLMHATAISVAFIAEEMDRNLSPDQVVILACQYCAVLGSRADLTVDANASAVDTLRGARAGRVVISVNETIQHTWDNDRFVGTAVEPSLTRHSVLDLLAAVGNEDQDGNGSMNDIIAYIARITGDEPFVRQSRQSPPLPHATFIPRQGYGADHDARGGDRPSLDQFPGAVGADGHYESVTHAEARPRQSSNYACFFSYKHEDMPLVQRVHDDLIVRGVMPIWMDRRVLQPGDLWKSEITQVIDQCTHLVVFVSRLALSSNQVEYEYRLADKLGKTLIPVMIEDGMPTRDLPLPLQRHNALPLTPRDDYLLGLVNLARSLPRRAHTFPSLAHVPAGRFVMGGPGEEHYVDLPEFWIGQAVVSVTEYAQFIEAGGLYKPEYWPSGVTENWLRMLGHSRFWPSSNLTDFALKHPLQPMRGLIWAQAFAYCQWLNYMIGRPGYFGLPNEAEWEKSSRGTDQRCYPWGSTWIPGIANTQELGTDGPTDIGYLGVAGDSPYGCKDMAGNVWEWTQSLPVPLPYIAGGSRERAATSDDPRVIRGGSWVYARSLARTYSRASELPVPQLYRREIGMRIAAHQDPHVS